MEEYFFNTKGLTVGYDGVPVVRDIELSLKKGEILTLIGPNGAGKTTILKSIIRQLEPVAGSVWLDGRDMAGMSGSERSKTISVVLTERLRTELMTCGEVVAMGRYPYTGRFGLLAEGDRKIVREAMELVQIADLADRDFGKISDGQKQRVMLARAICQEPDLLVLDEPTSFLDVHYKLEFLSVLQQLCRRRRVAVVMSLHELDLAERVSDRIACVMEDRIDRFGTPEEIFVPGYIPELYGIRAGSYDGLSGSVELAAPAGAPEVFVVAGNGRGTSVFRRLQREGVPFATGILWENDIDYPAARALAAEVVSVKPFTLVSETALLRARELMGSCREVIWAIRPEELGELGAKLSAFEEYKNK